MSRPSVPPGGLAQCSVGSTGSRWGRKLPLASTSSLIHLMRTGRFHLDSIVSEGALCNSRPLLLARLTAPYPHTVVAGSPPSGRMKNTPAPAPPPRRRKPRRDIADVPMGRLPLSTPPPQTTGIIFWLLLNSRPRRPQRLGTMGPKMRARWPLSPSVPGGLDPTTSGRRESSEARARPGAKPSGAGCSDPCGGRGREAGGCGPRVERAQVVGALEGGRVVARGRAHAAPQLGHRLVLVVGHPGPQLGLDRREMLGAVAQHRRSCHGHVGAYHQGLDDVAARVNTGRGRQRDRRGEDGPEHGDPAERQGEPPPPGGGGS